MAAYFLCGTGWTMRNNECEFAWAPGQPDDTLSVHFFEDAYVL